MDLDLLLPGIVAGDVDAFGRWVAAAEPRIRASLRPFAASVDAEAILQETLLRVWQLIPRFVPDGRTNGTLRLAFRVARNLAVDEVRRLRCDPTDPAVIERVLDEAAGRATPAEPDPRLRELLEACREQLPRQPGRALTARIESDGTRPDRALAKELGMQLNTFLQNVSRARRLLQACLEERGVRIEEELT